jgi:hypothetical protein
MDVDVCIMPGADRQSSAAAVNERIGGSS